MPDTEVLSPLQGIARYRSDIRLVHPDGHVVVNPVLFATVFFEGGGRPEVRQALLACFDEFEVYFGAHLKGGILAGGSGKYSAKTPKGVEAIRQRIIKAPPHEAVEFVRSDVTDQYTASEYLLEALTNQQHPTLGDGGMLSHLKFALPWSLATGPEIAQYHDYLRFVCQTLPIRGGYGGLTTILPRDFDRYMPQEYELSLRFSGLEIDSWGFAETETYRILSQEGPRETGPVFGYMKPGANVLRVGHIKSVNWYTILGDVFVDRLGGEAVLRQRLAREDIGIERQGQCLLIRAGEFPRLGAPEEGLIEPYAFVNRVVRVLRHPDHDSLHSYIPDVDRADKNYARRWLARFDLPEDGPVVPWQPGDTPPAPRQKSTLSALPGVPCPLSGTWFAPNWNNREVVLKEGEPMPGVGETGVVGSVIWYLKD